MKALANKGMENDIFVNSLSPIHSPKLICDLKTHQFITAVQTEGQLLLLSD